jgi:hypothetical protein
VFGDTYKADGILTVPALSILNYYCPVKNGIGKKAMLNGCKIAVEYCFFNVQAPFNQKVSVRGAIHRLVGVLAASLFPDD